MLYTYPPYAISLSTLMPYSYPPSTLLLGSFTLLVYIPRRFARLFYPPSPSFLCVFLHLPS